MAHYLFHSKTIFNECDSCPDLNLKIYTPGWFPNRFDEISISFHPDDDLKD